MMLIHRCQHCGHPQIWHEPESCSYGHCRCRVFKAAIAPEVVSTFDVASGREVATLIGGGQVWNGGNRHRQTTCSCGPCRQVMSRLAGDAA